MKLKGLFTLFLPLFLQEIGEAQTSEFSPGIYFAGKNVIQDTSYLDLTASSKLHFSNQFSLSFEVSIWDVSKYGYIFDLTDEQRGFAIRLTYDRASSLDTSYFVLSLLHQQEFLKIPHPKNQFKKGEWLEFLIHCDFDSRKLTLKVDSGIALSCSIARSTKTLDPSLVFGTNEDPAMAIRNVKIFEDEKLIHHFPLAEQSGNRVHDVVGGRVEFERGLEWLAPLHAQWLFDTTFVGKKWMREKPNYPSSWTTIFAWREATQQVYIFDKQRLSVYSLLDRSMKAIPFHGDWTSVVIFDDLHRQIFMGQAGGGKMMKLDEVTGRWLPNHPHIDPDSLPFGSPVFVNPLTGDILSLGGYGWFTYKNILRVYNFKTETWDTLKTKGEAIEPRADYGVARGEEPWELLLYGGFGSPSGKQGDGELMYNDLWSLDLRTFTLRRIWAKERIYTFRGGGTLLKIPDRKEYLYILHKKGPKGVRYEMMRGKPYSDSLELVLDTLMTKGATSFYYDERAHQIVQLYDPDEPDGVARTSIYTRAYPFLNPSASLSEISRQESNRSNWIIVVIAGIAIVGWVLFARRRGRPDKEKDKSIPTDTAADGEAQGELPSSASIQLFGKFKVISSRGEDLTHEFSPKLLQLFLLILLHRNGDEGITSEQINTLLWPETGPREAKNLRGVAFNKLRAILERIGEVTIEHHRKVWGLNCGKKVNCDYQMYRQFSGELKQSEKKIPEFLKIVGKGKFLDNVSFESIDSIKSSINQEIISALDQYVQRNGAAKNSTLRLKALDALLLHDSLNEQAMTSKVRILFSLGHVGEAKKTYEAFAHEYRVVLAQSYRKNLKDLLKAE